MDPYAQTGGYGMPQSSYGGYNMDPYAQMGGYGMPQSAYGGYNMDPYAQSSQPSGYGGSYSPMPQPYSPY
jgi:hypothetical protein